MPLLRQPRRSCYVPPTNRHEYNDIVVLSTEHVLRGWLDGQSRDGTRVRLVLEQAGWVAYLRGVALEGVLPAPSWEAAADHLRLPLAAEKKLLRVGA